MDCAVLRLFLEKFRRDARIKRGGVGYAETYSYTPPLFFFNTSHTQRLNTHTTTPTARLHSTAPLNAFRTLTLLLHAFNSAFLTNSHLCPIPALSACLCTPANFNVKYCLPCLIYLRLALFVCRASSCV